MKSLLTYVPLILCFCLLAGYNFMQADWSAPTATAPADNTAAPVNIGSTTQAKSGNLAANIFAATTEIRDAGLVEALHGFVEGVVPVVAGMVVGERDGVEAAGQDGQYARVGAKGDDLAGVRVAAAGNRAFEVAEAVIGFGEEDGERGKRVAAGGDGLAGTVVEHDVAGEKQRDGFGVCEAGEQAEKGGCCDHGSNTPRVLEP